MRDGKASRTAVLVCQGRAAAGDSIDDVAYRLLDDDERKAVDDVRTAIPPSEMRDRMRYEMVRLHGVVMAPRTRAIDDAIRDRATPQVVILGAGLDARAYRMRELGDVVVFEIDHPDSQRDKQRRIAAAKIESVARDLRLVAVDFAVENALDTALAAAGHDASKATTWIWEGVVPYLTNEQIDATLAIVSKRSATNSRVVVAYQSPGATLGLGRLAATAMAKLVGDENPWAREPVLSNHTADEMRALLGRHGFRVERDGDLIDLGADVAAAGPMKGSLERGRIVVADRT